MLQPQFNQELRTSAARQQNSIIGRHNAIHTNPYLSLEKVVSTFMNTLAHKDQILTNPLAHNNVKLEILDFCKRFRLSKIVRVAHDAYSYFP